MKQSHSMQHPVYTVVDVRTPAEFNRDHIPGSINIPLQEIPQRIEDFKAIPGQIVLCCASGQRSGQATQYLHQYGIECINGGSWTEAQHIIPQPH